MTRLRHFPVAKRFLNGTLKDQARAIERELAETFDFVYRAECDENLTRMAEETWDTIHASETLLAMLTERGIDVDAIRNQVEQKNRDRGYYDAEVASRNACPTCGWERERKATPDDYPRSAYNYFAACIECKQPRPVVAGGDTCYFLLQPPSAPVTDRHDRDTCPTCGSDDPKVYGWKPVNISLGYMMPAKWRFGERCDFPIVNCGDAFHGLIHGDGFGNHVHNLIHDLRAGVAVSTSSIADVLEQLMGVVESVPFGECERIREGRPMLDVCWPCEFKAACDAKRDLHT